MEPSRAQARSSLDVSVVKFVRDVMTFLFVRGRIVEEITARIPPIEPSHRLRMTTLHPPS